MSNNSTIIQNIIPKQIIQNKHDKILIKLSTFLAENEMWTMLIGIFLSYVGNGCKDHWIVFVRSLQLILNLPMIKIAFP